MKATQKEVSLNLIQRTKKNAWMALPVMRIPTDKVLEIQIYPREKLYGLLRNFTLIFQFFRVRCLSVNVIILLSSKRLHRHPPTPTLRRALQKTLSNHNVDKKRHLRDRLTNRVQIRKPGLAYLHTIG